MKRIPIRMVKTAHLAVVAEKLSTQSRIIDAATDFVRQIEMGNLQAQYSRTKEAVDTDILGKSLESMRDKLKEFSFEEKQRHWVSEGLARFVEILRSGRDIHSLADDIIGNLIRYMNANQGALYIVNDDNPNDIHLEMIGCYAYNRKKHLSQRIDPGQGIAGQILLEKTTCNMTDIPSDYVKITSGLGEALPRNLLIVPLKINEDVHGLVELASFHIIKPHEIRFVESLAESIASTIASVKNMERTKRLLQETQLQSEQMRAVEEEMRQNMEELTATQEEMTRAQKRTEDALREVSAKENYMLNMLNASNDGILTVDKDYKVVLANPVVQKTFLEQGFQIQPGFDIKKLRGDEQEDEFLAPYHLAFQGKVAEVERSYFDHHYQITYNPITDNKKNIVGVSVFTRDITEFKKLLHQAEQRQREEVERGRLVEQNREVLNKLIKNPDIQDGNLNGALDAISTALASVLGISRAAVWSYSASNQSIYLEKMYLAEKGEYVSGGELFKKDIPTYFASVETEEVIVAKNTFEHPSLVEFRKGYLDVFDIRSMLDVPFFIDGRVGGVICCENQGTQKNWTNEEVDFAKSVADIITVAYKSAHSKKLLHEANHLTEELRAQEEEIRQNMEELSATQEEVQRQLTAIEKLKTDLETRERVFSYTTILSESDSFGTIMMVNDKLCEVSGYSREELIGMPHKIFRHPDMPKELFATFWQTIKNKGVFTGIIKNRRKDGTAYWVDATIVPIIDHQGQIVKYIGARYHITNDTIALQLYNDQARLQGWPVLTH